jgi:hypothetical protein
VNKLLENKSGSRQIITYFGKLYHNSLFKPK